MSDKEIIDALIKRTYKKKQHIPGTSSRCELCGGTNGCFSYCHCHSGLKSFDPFYGMCGKCKKKGDCIGETRLRCDCKCHNNQFWKHPYRGPVY